MDRRTFTDLRDLVYERSGITLRPGKEAMVRARLAKRMRTLGLKNHRDYLTVVQADSSGEEITQMLDAISTNVTTFFRERDHFDLLRTVMTQWVLEKQRRFRFWSAACSSGEEPYSMAMTLLDTTQFNDVDMRILATDISTRVLHTAREGAYDCERMEPVPKTYRTRFFDRQGRGDCAVYHVNQRLRNTVLFKRLNLMDTPLPIKGPLDAVFCRNVMIYFDNAGRIKLLDEMFRVMKPGGYLFVGHAESLTGLPVGFKFVQASVYVKP